MQLQMRICSGYTSVPGFEPPTELSSRKRPTVPKTLHKKDMPEEGCHMKIGLVRCAPSTIGLIRKRARRSHRAEEVHAPLGPLSPALVDIEEPKRDLDCRDPLLLGFVERCRGCEFLRCRVGDVGPGENGAGCADLGWVVDPGAEGLIVRGYFELEVILGVIDASILCKRELVVVSAII